MRCSCILFTIMLCVPLCVGQKDVTYEDYDDLYYDESAEDSQEVFSTTTIDSTTINSSSFHVNTTLASETLITEQISTTVTPVLSTTQRRTIKQTVKIPRTMILAANLGGLDETGEPQEEYIEIDIPDSCKDYRMLLTQPALLDTVPIPKCCKPGESYYFDDTGKGCAAQGATFDFNLIQAVFFDGCIEDREINVTYNIFEKPPCEGGLLYNINYGDLLYIISNGSLLRIGSNWEYFDIFDDYCLDMVFEEEQFVLSAISCRDKDLPVMHVSRIQALICAVFMMISVPCLLAVAFIYFVVPGLNDLHGKALALHSICLATGYLLLAFIQFTGNYEGMVVGYIIQYAILACFFWLLVMVIDMSWQIWRYLPRNADPSEEKTQQRFIIYSLISQCTPLIFVLLSYLNGYHGIPSYFLRAVQFDDLDSQKFFIPVVTFILVSAILLTIGNYFGLKHLKGLTILAAIQKIDSGESNREYQRIRSLDNCKIEKVEIMKISTTFLLSVMSITWLCEIISFYFTSAHLSPILFLDIINALQGVFIFLLFLCLPRQFKLIKCYIRHAYNDRVTRPDTEMAETTNFIQSKSEEPNGEITVVK